MRRIVLLVGVLAVLLGVSPTWADEGASMTDAYVTETYTADEATVMIHTGSDGHTYSIEPFCGRVDDAECYSPHSCGGAPPGQWYLIIQDGTTPIGRVCLTTQQANDLDGFNQTMILRAWRRLDWPSSELVIQPPDGETLVNFDTNFLTTNDSPTTRTVRLLGRTITIQATPATYTWHHGDGTDQSTESPGAAYPDLEVTHEYLRTGDYAPSVDTTYTGRFRINGGRWHAIDETLTVDGEAVSLTVIEATPELVG